MSLCLLSLDTLVISTKNTPSGFRHAINLHALAHKHGECVSCYCCVDTNVSIKNCMQCDLDHVLDWELNE